MRNKNKFGLFLLLLLTITVKGQEQSAFFLKEDLMSIGIYYYPEHWDKNEWERDIKNISEIGFKFIHIAEFAWINLEPVEGQYRFEWLDVVVNLAGKYNLKVIMSTPTAIAPIWMGIKHPNLYVEKTNHLRGEHGTRALQSLSNPVWWEYSKKIITKLAVRYGNNPIIAGWQLDNEPEAKEDYSPEAEKAYKRWLELKYKSIDNLNDAWGTKFWSQLYSNFSDIKIHNNEHVGWWGTNPHGLLDYKRFLADQQAAFLDFQAEVLRSLISKNQYITTNYTATTFGADPSRTKKLDFDAFTSYPNKGLANIGELGFRLGDPKELSFALSYFKKPEKISGVMELQPGFVNWGQINPLLQPGVLRMWLYHCFGEGLSFACSYRYRQINYGAEQYHGGITTLDGQTLSQGGKDYQQTIKEIETLKKYYNPKSIQPEKLEKRKTALVWSHENLWSLSNQSQTKQWQTHGFFQKYLEIAKSLGAPANIIGEDENLTPYKVVIIPAYELVDDNLIKKWDSYVRAGGNLVVTLRTGVKDRNGHFFRISYGGKIESLIDSKIDYFDHLLPNVKGTINYKNKEYYWNNWADLLVPNNPNNVLATYSNQFYAGKAAVITNTIGKGKVTYIGVDTDDALLEKDIIKTVYENANIKTEDYPEGVYVVWRDGFWVAVNYSSTNYNLSLDKKSKLVIGDTIVEPGDVSVWIEEQ